ncbi:hypothetical protein J2T59_000270 [Methanosalsum natronophilum]|nr:hypothetical protein [Methanosalsum natronophilum]
MYGKARNSNNGWAKDLEARSLTMVRDIAWPKASFYL